MPRQPFQARPGQVDYTHARYAPVVNCVVKHGDKILIVQRSAELNFYPNYWNGISGFLDDQRTINEKVREELTEELSLPASAIQSVIQVGLFEQDEPAYQKIWIVHPVLVEVNTDNIQLDWEAQDCKWVTVEEAKTYTLLPGFDRVLQAVALLLETRRTA